MISEPTRHDESRLSHHFPCRTALKDTPIDDFSDYEDDRPQPRWGILEIDFLGNLPCEILGGFASCFCLRLKVTSSQKL